MEQWDKDFIDEEVPGHFTIRKDGTGSFQFGLVQGEMDCCNEKTNGRERLDFSWEGLDECDAVSGRGWAEVRGNKMAGRLFFHLGDSSGFTAVRK